MARITDDNAKRDPSSALRALGTGLNPDGSPYTLPVHDGAYTWKAEQYTSLALYQTGLATEVAAGWQVVATGALSTNFIVTYRKQA